MNGSAPSGSDGFIARASAADGRPVWAWTYGGSGADTAAAVIATDSEIALTGHVDSENVFGSMGGSFDAAFARLNANGEVLSKLQLGSEHTTLVTTDQIDLGKRLVALPGGGFAVGIQTQSNFVETNANVGSRYDAAVVKLDASGTPLAASHIGTSTLPASRVNHHDYVNGMAVLDDGSIMIGGPTHSDLGGTNEGAGYSDLYFAGFDADLVLQGIFHLGTSITEIDAGAVHPCGAVYAGGRTKGSLFGTNPNEGGSEDPILVRMPASGDF